MIDYTEDVAKKYTQDREKYTVTDSRSFKELDSIGVKGKDVLDFGCGDAIYAVRLAQLGAKTVTGIDSSSAMIELAEHRLESTKLANVKVLEADGSKLPFNDESFDVVFSNFVLHYFPDPLKPFAEIQRVLRKDGTLLVLMETCEVRPGFEYLYNSELPIRLGPPEGFTPVTILIKPLQEIVDTMKKVGLNPLVVEPQENPSTTIDPNYPHANQVTKTVFLLRAKKI